jgi:predicted nucleic acid-binding protein
VDPVLLDTGPLLTFLAEGLEHHDWVCAQWASIPSPMLTCEPVFTEAAFLLEREGLAADPLFVLMERGVIRVGLHVEEHQAELRALMRRYQNRPMSLADACLVRMSEIYAGATVFTLDSDFLVYRRHGRNVLPVLMPPAG